MKTTSKTSKAAKKPATAAKTTRTTRATSTRPASKSKSKSPSRATSNTQLLQGVFDALNRVQAVIEFEVDGTIITANENFLSVTGYTLNEIVGQHHRIFVDSRTASSAEYREFWNRLGRGEFDAGEYRRYGKSGNEVWINASYNPVLDAKGNVVRVVKFATDITAAKSTLGRTQAVIEFNLDGTVTYANENFCKTLGYNISEILGKHHRMFCDPAYTSSQEYQSFWENLRRGEYQTGQFKRLSKSGKELWMQASYNPVFDAHGKPARVVKYASDITTQKEMEFQFAERQKLDAQAAAEQREKVSVLLSCVNAIAKGDFSGDVPDLGVDAVGQVGTALRSAVDSIRSSLVEVSLVSATVASAAEQLSAASREISNGAQTQASSLEETASSLEEITSTVKQNSDNAQQARQLAVGSRDIAEKGGAVVSDAVAAMADINQSSKKIADIITTIDEIAFQTNLLALNAAVEAARAGEQGRGFAVVAAEVRNLAQRSASAAKEIKSLIQDSVSRVENGTHLVNKSGETLNEIMNSVKRVTDIVSEIAAASKEQLTGIEQVNKAVTQMDRVTQANASQTEEVSGTATSLLSHAEQLRDEVRKFQLGNIEQSHGTQRNTNSGRSATRAGSVSTATQPVTRSTSSEFDFQQVDDKLAQLMEF